MNINSENKTQNKRYGSLGLGIFLLLAGGALLAERFGLIPNTVQWGFPAVLIAWGISEIISRFKG